MNNTQAKPLDITQLNPLLDVTLISDIEGLEAAREFLKNNNVLGYDVETNMTSDFTERKIRTIQFGNRNKQIVIDLLPFAQAAGITLEEAFAVPYKPHECMRPVIDALEPALHSRTHTKIGHAIQFDYEATKYCLGIRMFTFHCTFLAEKILNCGKVPFKIKGFWALDDLVAKYMGLQICKDEQTSFDLTTPLTDSQITYCALDARLPLGVRTAQLKQLDALGLQKVTQIENDAIPAFGDMYLNGMKVDKKKWLKVVWKYKKIHKKNIAVLDKFFIPVVGTKYYDNAGLDELEAKWRDEKDKVIRAENRKAFMAERKRIRELKEDYETFAGQAAINYASPLALYKVMKGLPKFIQANAEHAENRKLPAFKGTDDRTLKNFAEHPDWELSNIDKFDVNYEQIGMIDALRLYRESEKLLNSYGTDWLRKNIHPKTQRVHSRINQIGAETGRTSSEKPNMQQLPNGAEWRSCFISEDGYDMITSDMSQAEVRILAELSQDPLLVEAYQKGWDIYSVLGELIFAEEWKAIADANPDCAYTKSKKKCKCHKILRDRAKPLSLGKAYGMEYEKLSETIGVSHKEAKDILAEIDKRLPVLIDYLATSGNATKDSCESRSMAGRIRYFNRPNYQQATNSAIAAMKKKGIENKQPSSRDISWKLRSMYSAIEREGKNNPLQSTNVDLAKIIMGVSVVNDLEMMWNNLETKFNAKLCLFVHDEFIIECPKDKTTECVKYIEKCMIVGSTDILKLVPMGCETNISSHWKK